MTDTPARLPYPREDWVRAHLPDDLPEALLQRGFDAHYALDGLTVRDPAKAHLADVMGDVVFTATDEEELNWYLAADAVGRILDAMRAQHDEAAEKARWRYVPVDLPDNARAADRAAPADGHTLFPDPSPRCYYRENRPYTYNAIYTPSKGWYEQRLRLMAHVPPASLLKNLAAQHLRALNAGYPADRPHWGYDEATRTFVEVSDAREIIEGLEEPRPGSILADEELSDAPRAPEDQPFPHAGWLLDHLPLDLPVDVLAHALTLRGSVGRTAYYGVTPGVGGALAHDVYYARDEADMRLWLFRRVSLRIAEAMYERDSAQEAARWRYEPVACRDGRWLYRENGGYDYAAIHDPTKYVSELQLTLLRAVLTATQLDERIAAATGLLNRCCGSVHWAFDRAAFRFVEIGPAITLPDDQVLSDAAAALHRGSDAAELPMEEELYETRADAAKAAATNAGATRAAAPARENDRPRGWLRRLLRRTRR